MKRSRFLIAVCFACSTFTFPTSLCANGVSLNLHGVPSNVTVSCGAVPPPDVVTATSSCMVVVVSGEELRLHYSFDTNSGSIVNDEGPNGNSGIVNGTVTWQTNAHPGTGAAMEFSGDGTAYIHVGTNSSTVITNAFTLAAWIYPTSNLAGGGRGVIAKGANDSSQEYGFSWFNGRIIFSGTSNPQQLWTDAAAAPLDTWTHVACTLSATGQSRVYINGQLYTNGMMNMPQVLSGVRPLYVGRWRSGFDFAGMIDAVRIYGRALSSNEVVVLAGNTPSGSNPVPVTLLESTNGTCPHIISRVWTASDGCGSSVSATQQITVLDNAAPSLVGVPSDVILFCGQPLPPAPGVLAVDDCGSVPVMFNALTSGVCPSVITRTWSATDGCGNSTCATQTITLQSASPPVLIGVPSNVSITCGSIPPPPPLVTATGSCAAVVTLAQGQVLYYSFDNDTGSAVMDESGNGNTGVVNGSAAWLTGAHAGTGGAMDFDGEGTAYVDGGMSSSLTMTGAFSLAAWIYPASNWIGGRGIIAKGANTNSQEYGFSWFNGHIIFSGTSNPQQLWTDAYAAPLDQWTHLACTLSAGGQSRVFINGQLYTNGVMSMPQALAGPRPFYVGRWRNGFDFNGIIDEVRVHRRELTPGEIALLAGAAGSGSDAVPVVMTETTNGSCPAVITRVWTATDGCGNSVSATQTISIGATVPVLAGVPSDATVACGAVPPPATVTATSDCVSATSPANGLVLSYSFGSNSSSTVMDDSGNGNTGIVNGTVTWLTNGHPGTGAALQFSGDGGAYVYCGTSSSVVITGAFSLAAWIRPTSTWVDVRGIVVKGAQSDGFEYGMGWLNGRIVFTGTSGLQQLWTDAVAAPLGVWTHVACTLNTAGQSRIYINGQFYTNGIMSMPQALGGFRPLYVGRWRSGFDFSGTIDEVQIYKCALSSNEVAVLAGVAVATGTTLQVSLAETTNGACPQVISRVWTATDGCGGSVSATQTITVVDTAAPILVGVPASAIVFCGEPLPAVPAVIAVDECGDVPVLFNAVTNGSCSGTVTRTWTATDRCGNSTSAVQVITQQPPPPPVLVGVPADAVVACGQVPPPDVVTATGSCLFTPTNGVVLHYSFDINTGAVVVDESGNGITGAVSGIVTWRTNGHPGTGAAMQFPRDGSSYINAGTNSSLTITGALTLAAWINPTSTWPDIVGVIAKGADASSYEYGLAWYNGRAKFHNSVTAESLITDASAAPMSVWTHVACTLNTSGEARIYINGQLYTNGFMSMPKSLGGYRPLYVGRWRSGFDFSGTIDEVRIYKRALSSNEVALLAGAAADTGYTVPVSLVVTTNGMCPQVISRVWSATDFCGGTVSATQTITVVDTTAPILVGVPADTIAFCGEPLPVAPAVTAVDDCDSVPVIFAAVTNGSCPGTITRTWIATDGCGNSTSATQLITIMALHEVASDFDGDGLTDITTYWPGGGQWYALKSSGPGYQTLQLGSSNMVPVAADYDGDGWTDYAVYHAAAGAWHIRQSSTSNVVTRTWGYHAALAVAADYDGDGKADLATYVPESGGWYILQSASNRMRAVQWGWVQAMPVPADYDGDGKSDVATYVPANGTWYILKSGGGTAVRQWGWSQAMPVPADYDGDGKVDIATYVPANGTWYIIRSGGGVTIQQWGWSQAAPVPGDYDGDGKADIATYQPSSGTWYILKSTGGYRQVPWGWSEAVPVMPQFQLNRRYFPSP